MVEDGSSKGSGKDLDKRVESYRKGLLMSKGIMWAPEVVNMMTRNYAKALNATTLSPEVKERIKQLASGSGKVKVALLRLWNAARVRKLKELNLHEVAVELASIIRRNGVPLNLAKEVLRLAGYTEQEIDTMLPTIESLIKL
jgi:predicted DNA-binding protein